MKALVVHGSMYGNTAAVAGSIGRGLQQGGFDAEVAPLDRAEPVVVAEIDLLVVGGPTHAHGMSRTSTRGTALNDAKNAHGTPTASPGSGTGSTISRSATGRTRLPTRELPRDEGERPRGRRARTCPGVG